MSKVPEKDLEKKAVSDMEVYALLATLAWLLAFIVLLVNSALGIFPREHLLVKFVVSWFCAGLIGTGLFIGGDIYIKLRGKNKR